MTNKDLIIGCASHITKYKECVHPCKYDSICERFIMAYDYTPKSVLPQIEYNLNMNKEAFLEWCNREVGK